MEGVGWNGTVIRSEEVKVFREDDLIGRSGGKMKIFLQEGSKIGELGFCDLMESFSLGMSTTSNVIEILQGDTWNLVYEELELIIVS